MTKLNQKNLEETIRLQQEASNPQSSVFVCASAGSGKTKILTDRVLRLLLEGVNPNKILCLTFTKVAAFEMQSRIYKELSSWSILEDEELKRKVSSLVGKNLPDAQIKKSKTLFNVILDDFEGIKINTIHSFCQNLMTKFPVESKIKPNFQIIDTQTENKLLLEAKNKLLQEALIDSDLSKKVETISSNLNENSFLEIILELLSKRTDLQISKEKLFGLENLNKLIFTILNCENVTQEEIDGLVTNPDVDTSFDSKNLNLLSQAGSNSKKITDTKHSKAINQYLKNPDQENFHAYKESFLTQKNELRKSVFNKDVMSNVDGSENTVRLEQKRLLALIEKINSFQIAKLTSTLLEVSDKMLGFYQNLKNQNNYLDYNDLISKTSELLNNKENSEWIKYKLDGSIEHILVDESQDTNNHQWRIIKAISEDFFSGEGSSDKNKTIFVVGDDKQSIYNFQGADPKIFGDVMHYYSNQLESSNQTISNISLNNSFRSLKNILQAVDNVFSKPEYQKSVSQINIVKHRPIRVEGAGKVELWPIINVQKENDKKKDDFSWKLDFNPSEDQNSKEILAKIIAKNIKTWLDEKKVIKSEKRVIKASDIMILLKNRTNNLGNLIIKNLQKENIPVNGSDKVELIKNIIVKDLVSFAKFLLLSEDDLNLAALLKSPLIGISEDELFYLCLIKNNEQISLFTALRKNHDIRLKTAFSFLEEVKTYYENNPYQIYQLFIHILEVKNKKSKIISALGSESKEIINHFLNLCLEFEKREISSLENFICTLDNFNLNVKIDNNNKEFDEVRITTIHSAKGLESHIVILADSAHDTKGKYGASNEKITWLSKEDFKIPLWQASKECELTKNIKEQELSVKKDEYLRLLYVAMTRARDELYIAGFGKNIAPDCWYSIIKNNSFAESQSKKSNFEGLINCENQNFMEDDRVLFIQEEDGQEVKITQETQTKPKEFPIPAFLNKISDQEKTQNIIYPSLQIQDSDERSSSQGKKYNIGTIVHKILEIFPNKLDDISSLNSLIEKYLDHNHGGLTKEEKLETIRQTSSIFNDDKFKFLFTQNSQSEVPVIGKINDQQIVGTIDRLIVNDNEVIIIDYKSNQLDLQDVQSTITKYSKQLNLYKKVIQEVYPLKKIKCAIIWTSIGEISYL
jgi:ATP-dependent helicase/nuclease subunit A